MHPSFAFGTAAEAGRRPPPLHPRASVALRRTIARHHTRNRWGTTSIHAANAVRGKSIKKYKYINIDHCAPWNQGVTTFEEKRSDGRGDWCAFHPAINAVGAHLGLVWGSEGMGFYSGIWALGGSCTDPSLHRDPFRTPEYREAENEFLYQQPARAERHGVRGVSGPGGGSVTLQPRDGGAWPRCARGGGGGGGRGGPGPRGGAAPSL